MNAANIGPAIYVEPKAKEGVFLLMDAQCYTCTDSLSANYDQLVYDVTCTNCIAKGARQVCYCAQYLST